MAEYQIIPKATIDAIEESIQRKRGETSPISPSQMPLAIDTIPSSVDGTDAPIGGIYLTKPDSNGNPTECQIVGWSPIVDYSWSTQISYPYFPLLEKIDFLNCDKIRNIGASAFNGCLHLTEIHLPNSLVTIESQAFYNCSSLTTINLPNSLTSLGVSAFNGCLHLTEIHLPNMLTFLGNYAFYNCSSLTTINLPSSIATIGTQFFYGCTSLTNITIENGFNCNGLVLSSSTRYTAETIVSWLEALADRRGQATFTLTIGTTNLNKLTAEQKAIATNKNWTLA